MMLLVIQFTIHIINIDYFSLPSSEAKVLTDLTSHRVRWPFLLINVLLLIEFEIKQSD